MIKTEESLVRALARARQERQALSVARDAIDRARQVAGDVHATPESWLEVPRAYANMASAYKELGRPREAGDWYRKATAEWDKLRATGAYFPDSQGEMDEARKGAQAGGISGGLQPAALR